MLKELTNKTITSLKLLIESNVFKGLNITDISEICNETDLQINQIRDIRLLTRFLKTFIKQTPNEDISIHYYFFTHLYHQLLYKEYPLILYLQSLLSGTKDINFSIRFLSLSCHQDNCLLRLNNHLKEYNCAMKHLSSDEIKNAIETLKEDGKVYCKKTLTQKEIEMFKEYKDMLLDEIYTYSKEYPKVLFIARFTMNDKEKEKEIWNLMNWDTKDIEETMKRRRIIKVVSNKNSSENKISFNKDNDQEYKTSTTSTKSNCIINNKTEQENEHTTNLISLFNESQQTKIEDDSSNRSEKPKTLVLNDNL